MKGTFQKRVGMTTIQKRLEPALYNSTPAFIPWTLMLVLRPFHVFQQTLFVLFEIFTPSRPCAPFSKYTSSAVHNLSLPYLLTLFKSDKA